MLDALLWMGSSTTNINENLNVSLYQCAVAIFYLKYKQPYGQSLLANVVITTTNDLLQLAVPDHKFNNC